MNILDRMSKPYCVIETYLTLNLAKIQCLYTQQYMKQIGQLELLLDHLLLLTKFQLHDLIIEKECTFSYIILS